MIQIPREELDGRYFATSNGSIYNKYGEYVKPFIADNGYLRVKLHVGHNKYKNYTLSVLIAESFIPNPDNLPQVNHKDGNKLNNDISNLEWCTQSYNIRHAISHGLYNNNNQHIASIANANANGIPIEQLDKDGVVINTFKNKHDAARKLGLMPNNIKRAITSGCRCGGYRWRKVGGHNE